MDTATIETTRLQVGVGKQVKGPDWTAYLVRLDASGAWVGYEVLLATGEEAPIKQYAERTAEALGATFHIEGEAATAPSAVDSRWCAKCGREVAKSRHFWVLVSELNKPTATFCPKGGLHEVDEEDECE